MNTFKKILAVLAMFATAAVFAQAQGYVSFANDNTTRISTNSTVGGAASGLVTTFCHYALYVSTTATNVGGQTAAIVGTNNPHYAFTDGSWTLAAYGTNFISAGRFISANADVSGRTAVPGVSGGSSANFVVIGWSDSIGTDIAAVQSWYNGGTPVSSGWIGQSSVSGAVTLGATTAATLFATNNTALIKGFVLGRVATGGSPNVAPTITTQPTNKSAVFGGSVTFMVGYGGNPTPAFQWQFNGNNIPGATGPTLNLNNLTYSNAGTYSVILTNIAGSVTSSNATLTVTTPPANIIFANTSASVTKTFTNSTVGGAATGLTIATNFVYRYALYVSTNATAVNGQTSAILGADSTNYAFADANWAFVAYGTNNGPGRLTSVSADNFGKTAVTYASGQSTARFVVIGWSSDIGTDIASLSTWFNGGSPSSDGWIGQSSVSGAVPLGGALFSTNSPYLQGFTLGLVSGMVNGHVTYAIPPAPPLMVQATLNGSNIQLAWPLSAGTYGVQSASSPAGPWSDAGLTITSDDIDASATAPVTGDQQYFRLVQQ